MKIRHVTLLLMSLSVAGTAMAGPGIKVKAKQMQSQEVIEQGVTRVQEQCGNTNLEASIDWKSWGEYNYKDARLNAEDVAGWVGGQVNNIYDDMVELCTTIEHSELYKAEFSKLKKLKFSGQTDINERDTSFSLSDDGTELSIQLNGNGTYNSKFGQLLQDTWG